MRPLAGRILASFPRLVADAFSPLPVETISRPFSAALGPQVSKPTFGGTGVSDCAVRRNHLSVLASPSNVGNSAGEQSGVRAEHACALTPHATGVRTRLPSQEWNRKGWAIGLTRTPARHADPASRGADGCRPSACWR